MGFLADLFKGVNNKHWELSRLSSAWAILSTSALAGYKVYAGQDLPISDYAQAMMLVMGGCAVFIAAKDVARTNALSKEPHGETS
jgi:hypothetical protein